MSVRTRLAAGLAMAPLLAAGLLLAATPAWAANELKTPDTVTAHGPVLLEGTVDDTQDGNKIELRVTAPGAPFQSLASREPQTGAAPKQRSVSFTLDTNRCTLKACAGAEGLDLPNGSYLVELVSFGLMQPPAPTCTPTNNNGKDPKDTGCLLASKPVVIDVRARPPSNPSATAAGPQITVSWDRGPEPDLIDWQVKEKDGAPVTIRPGGAPDPCAAGRCQAVFGYTAADTGVRSFTVSAARACGPKDCTPARGLPSAEVSATLAPGATGSSGGAPIVAGPGFSTPPAGTSGTTFAQGFGSKLGLPKLPPLPTAPAPAIAPPADTFDPTLAYPEPGEQLAQPPEPVVAGRDARLTSTGDGLLQSEPVVRGVAGALVLVLTAAHLRRWLSVGIPDEQMD